MDPVATTIDLTPLLQAVVSLAVVLLTALGGWALKHLTDKLGLDKDSKVRQNIYDVFEKGLAYAAQKAVEKGQDFTKIEVKNQMIAEAAQYVIPKIPDGLAYFNITPKALEQMLEARLGTANLEVNRAAIGNVNAAPTNLPEIPAPPPAPPVTNITDSTVTIEATPAPVPEATQ